MVGISNRSKQIDKTKSDDLVEWELRSHNLWLSNDFNHSNVSVGPRNSSNFANQRLEMLLVWTLKFKVWNIGIQYWDSMVGAWAMPVEFVRLLQFRSFELVKSENLEVLINSILDLIEFIKSSHRTPRMTRKGVHWTLFKLIPKLKSYSNHWNYLFLDDKLAGYLEPIRVDCIYSSVSSYLIWQSWLSHL